MAAARRRRVVRARGAPPAALAIMARAYLLVLRAVHATVAAQVQDAASAPAGKSKTAAKLIDQAVRGIQSSVDADLKRLPGIDPSKVAGGELLVRQFRARNVGLIKTIAKEHLSRVDAVIAEHGGLHVKGLAKKLQEAIGVSEARAKFWARDQTLKLHADVVETKHKSLGIVEYVWRTSQDGTVRPDHADLEGKTFKYDDPPVVDQRTGRRENPGHDFNCRCHGDPVLPKAGVAVKPKPKPKPAPTPKPTPKPKPKPVQTINAIGQLETKSFQAVAPTLPPSVPPPTGLSAAAQLESRYTQVRSTAAFRGVRRPRTAEVNAKLVQHTHAINSNLDIRSAVVGFTDEWSDTIRLAERVRDDRLLPGDALKWEQTAEQTRIRVVDHIARLDQAQAAVAGLPRPHADLPLYRGIHVTPEQLTDMLGTQHVRLGGSSSTSFAYDAAASFAHIGFVRPDEWSVVFEIRKHRGGLAVEGVSAAAWEEEVIFGRQAVFRQVGAARIEGEARALLVTLEEI